MPAEQTQAMSLEDREALAHRLLAGAQAVSAFANDDLVLWDNPSRQSLIELLNTAAAAIGRPRPVTERDHAAELRAAIKEWDAAEKALDHIDRSDWRAAEMVHYAIICANLRLLAGMDAV